MTSFARDMLAGGTAASVAKTTMAPFERIKLLLQLQAVSTQMAKNQQYKVKLKFAGFRNYIKKELNEELKIF